MLLVVIPSSPPPFFFGGGGGQGVSLHVHAKAYTSCHSRNAVWVAIFLQFKYTDWRIWVHPHPLSLGGGYELHLEQV